MNFIKRSKLMQKLDLCKCEICGNLVEALIVGEGVLVCCGQDMTILNYNDDENFKMTHVPVKTQSDCGKTIIQVGEKEHVMTEEHFIEFIEYISQDKKYKCTQFLQPNETPQMPVCCKGKDVFVREYCNIHRLWRSEDDNIDK